MSNYRDDNQDTAIASDKAFGGLGSIFDGIARASDALLFGLAITVSGSALASDEVIDSSTQVLHDSALIADQPIGKKNASRLHVDGAQATEAWQHGLLAIQSDAAPIKDVLLDGSVGAIVSDNARINDEVISQRVASNLVVDNAQASDGLTTIERDLNSDSASVSDSISGKLSALQVVEDSAGISDVHLGTLASGVTDNAIISDNLLAQRIASSIIDDGAKATDTLLTNYSDVLLDSASPTDLVAGKQHSRNIIIDSVLTDDEVIDNINQNSAVQEGVFINDEVVDALNAAVLTPDNAVIEDEAVSVGGAQGQAWTANVDSWAMSRYNPYNYNRLVVINGVLYGEADDGIYRLDEQVSAVTASIKTGKMDLGKGALTHPSAAYLEYELSGGASMTVSSTQKGIKQQYTYMLPSEVADELTNGRFIFGRGLRGRHFAFELIMIGTHGHVNDLSIEHTLTSRRV